MNDVMKFLDSINRSPLPDTLKSPMIRVGVLTHRLMMDIRTTEVALKAIVNADIHHPNCVLDNCRPSCPIKLALAALKAVE